MIEIIMNRYKFKNNFEFTKQKNECCLFEYF